MSRNRKATEQRILEASRALILAEGFGGLGVNAVAKASSCDKVLVYRYFGSIDGLLEALVTAGPLLPPLPDDRSPRALASAIVNDPWAACLFAWEHAAANPLTASFRAERRRWIAGAVVADTEDIECLVCGLVFMQLASGGAEWQHARGHWRAVASRHLPPSPNAAPDEPEADGLPAELL